MGEDSSSATAEDGPVLEWELGLPTGSDLIPLSQLLVPPPLASAFSISGETPYTPLDVHRASHNTLSGLRRYTSASFSSSSSPFPLFSSTDPMLIDDNDDIDTPAADSSHKSSRPEDSTDPAAARTLKRPRLVWTPQLHKRFVAVVTHLGIKNAVPKTIMNLMNVDGLSRENVASHLQKYRLYLKGTQQGLSTEPPSSSSDHIFASTPIPHSLHEPPAPPKPTPMQHAMPSVIPMPVFSMLHGGSAGMGSHQGSPSVYHGFNMHHPYRPFGEHPKVWSGGGSNYGSMVSYPRVSNNDK